MADSVQPGDVVLDWDQPPKEQSPAIVTKVLDRQADHVYIPAIDATVAKANPDYPADDDVALIIFGQTLGHSGLDEDDLRGRIEEIEEVIDGLEDEWNINVRDHRYAYPVSRLKKIETDEESLVELLLSSESWSENQ